MSPFKGTSEAERLNFVYLFQNTHNTMPEYINTLPEMKLFRRKLRKRIIYTERSMSYC